MRAEPYFHQETHLFTPHSESSSYHYVAYPFPILCICTGVKTRTRKRRVRNEAGASPVLLLGTYHTLTCKLERFFFSFYFFVRANGSTCYFHLCLFASVSMKLKIKELLCFIKGWLLITIVT